MTEKIRCSCEHAYHQGKPCPNEVTRWLNEEMADRPVCTPFGIGRYCR